jgi:hypothetical protein
LISALKPLIKKLLLVPFCIPIKKQHTSRVMIVIYGFLVNEDHFESVPTTLFPAATGFFHLKQLIAPCLLTPMTIELLF